LRDVADMFEVMYLHSVGPARRVLPFTSSVYAGVVVPIPTYPFELMRIASVRVGIVVGE
jgi:hypothetical protein